MENKRNMSNNMLIDSNDHINDTLTQSFSQMNVDSPNELEPQLSRQHSRESYNGNFTNNSTNNLTRNNSRSRSTLIFDDDDDDDNCNDNEPYYNENSGDDLLSKTSSQISEESNNMAYNASDQQFVSAQQQQQQQQNVQQANPKNVMVPVDIVWQQGGNKAYVTGSFTNWRKMIGLVPVPGRPGLLHVKLQLPPGTHRFRFIVDNELRFSDYLPTATDQMGNFVNYLEVTAPSLQQQQQQQVDHSVEEGEYSTRDDTTSPDYSRNQNSSNKKKKTIPMSTRSRIAMEIEQEPDDMGDGYSRYYDEALSKPSLEYTQDIPAVFTDPTVMEQYYLTLDQQQNNHQNMAWLTPPQLPPHLENVILNSYSHSQAENNENNSGALPIPNHVILNHLATSSIKHNTLCVASIVRYKQKYVTQILYAPLQ
ncbi:Gal83p PWA37_001032 [Arxiozyma heterogenica]|uniref:Gal83p n=1 Tax=Arxiozyma heterogenica TaxID=278026 RepID=UPI002F1D3A6D